MERISRHISYKEATHSPTALRYGITNHPDDTILAAMRLVAERCFEPAREWYGKPIQINSFYRSFKLNLQVGGAVNSQHMKGEAIDIDTKDNAENARLYEWMRTNLIFDQLIWEYGNINGPDWIHVSYKQTGNRQQYFKIIKTT
jgi:hypothetical protein